MFPFWFIHNYKSMGTTIYRQLPEAYTAKYHGRRLIPGSAQQVSALGFSPTRKYSIDHMPMDALVALGMVPNARELSANTAIMMIVRNPIDRFLSICNFENIHPNALVERVKNVRLPHQYEQGLKDYQTHQHTHLVNAHGLKVYTVKMESRDKIVEFFKRFEVTIDLSVTCKVSEKRYALTEAQKEFVREFYKVDYELYERAA
jgi:hypothetical protein